MRGAGADHANARAAVIDVIRAAGTISRTEIVNTTRLTPGTVSGEVRRLLDEGLVVEVGRAPSTGGKPRRLLELVASSRFAVGIHLDHDGVTYALADLGGAIVARRRVDGVGEAEPDDVIGAMAREAAGIVADAQVDPARVLGLGVVSPGPLVAATGMVMSRPSLHRWVDYPLAARLEAASGLPVVVDNDATAAAVGEHWTRASEPSAAFSALYMATGIGSGTVVDGVPYRGASSNTGEIGHVCVAVSGPMCWCGNRGCVEAVAGPASVVAAARAAGVDVGAREGVETLERGAGLLRAFGRVVDAAHAGDARARAIFADSARYVAVAAQTLCSMMDVDLVVLTGPAFALAGELYLPVVQERVSRAVVAHGHGVRVRVSAHANQAAAVGAAALVLQSELVPRRFGVRLLVGAER